MEHELSTIKAIRRSLGLTQQQLAEAAQVSQSLIAKVESGLVDPSYSAGRRILETLRTFERRQEARARELMASRLISVKPEMKVKEAIRKMEQHAISQLPVLDGKEAVGLLTERAIVREMERIDHDQTIVAEVMEESPPIVPPETPRRVLAELLGHFSLVLVKEKGRMKGIVTKADLLRTV